MIQELIKNITSSLDRQGIPYMISGSLAFNMYCIPRMSMDIDREYINLWCKDLNL
jgi:hypothetical protein